LQEPPPNPDVLLEHREAPRRSAVEIEVPSPNGGHANGGLRPTTLGSSSLAVVPRDPAKSDSGILSAKELAAAFQLSFNEGGTITAPPASPPESNQEVVKPRRMSISRVLLVLTLLSLVGFGAVVWMTPPYQAKARELLGSGWNGVKQQFSTLGDSISDSPEVVAPPPQQPISSAQEEVPAEIKPEPQPTVADLPKPDLPAETTAAAAPPTDAETIRQLVRSLRSSAIDAEASGDFAKAVRQYESIRRFPREYWPSDLDLRLTLAKERL
jgi:hypothetical protein